MSEQIPTADPRVILIDRIISAYHTTRLRETPVATHILSKAHVQEAFNSLSATPTPAPDGLDWKKIAKLAGEHGVRYRTNSAMAAFLAALPASQPVADVSGGTLATLERVETVPMLHPFDDSGTDPIWRVVVGEYVADFDYKQAARNFAGAINGPVATLTARVEMLEGALEKANRATTDKAYMLAALVQMLGPNGRKVWDAWQAKGVQHIHTTSGPDTAGMSGEEIAAAHLAFEEATKDAVPIENIDSHIRTRAALSPDPAVKPSAEGGAA